MIKLVIIKLSVYITAAATEWIAITALFESFAYDRDWSFSVTITALFAIIAIVGSCLERELDNVDLATE